MILVIESLDKHGEPNVWTSVLETTNAGVVVETINLFIIDHSKNTIINIYLE